MAKPSSKNAVDPVSSLICSRSGSGRGRLTGKTFLAKDVFAVKGLRTGGGHPEFKAAQSVSEKDAAAIRLLENEGASLVGLTRLGELSRGLGGQNCNDGRIDNPAAPGRVPGGSSCGAAAAIAAGRADFAIATDTNGSVRVPASFCGIYGWRPSYGHVPSEGTLPYAPSCDTVGLLASKLDDLSLAAQSLLKSPPLGPPRHIRVATDAFELCNEISAQEVLEWLENLAIKDIIIEQVSVFCGLADQLLAEQLDAQGRANWKLYGQWLEEANPKLHFSTAIAIERDRIASLSPRNQYEAIPKVRDHSITLLQGAVLVMPTTGCSPWADDENLIARDIRFAALSRLVTYATACGLPEVTVPWKKTDTGPIGLSFIGSPGSDLDLFELARRIEQIGRNGSA